MPINPFPFLARLLFAPRGKTEEELLAEMDQRIDRIVAEILRRKQSGLSYVNLTY